MNMLLNGLRRTVTGRPGAVVLVILLITVLMGGLSTQGTVTSGSVNLSSDSEAALTAEAIEARFGADTSATVSQVIVRADDVLSPEGLAAALSLRAQISSDPAIAAAIVADPRGGDGITTWADLVIGAAVSQGLDPTALDDTTIDQLHAASLASLPPEQAAQFGQLASADFDTGMVIVMLDTTDDEALLDAQLAFGDLVGTDGVEIRPFNLALLTAESQDAIEGQMGRLLGLAMLLIIGILIAINRNVVDVVSSFAGLIMAIVWMQGLGTLLGPGFLEITDGMGDMTMAIPILLIGLGVDYGIHLSSRYREERVTGSEPTKAASDAIGAVGAALTLATITTVVGFLTNVANPLPPLQDFGIIAAVGVIAAFFIMTAFVPATRLLADGRYFAKHGAHRVQRAGGGEDGPGALGRLAASVAPLATRRPVAVLGVAGLLTIAAGFSASGLSTTFSQTEFFPSDSEALATILIMQDEFGGDLSETTRVLVTGDVSDTTVLDAYVTALADNPDVRVVDGAPQAQVAIAPDATSAMIAISTQAGEAGVDRLEVDLRGDAAILTDAGFEVGLTSENLLTDAVMDDLRNSQVTGLVLTLVASMVILALAFWFRHRTPMLGVLAIASVGVVTVWVLGVMAAVGIPFNMMTAMISALAIGIGVPFGIHVVNRFLEERAITPDAGAALTRTLEQTGGALVGSALTTMAGFGVLALSTISPMRQFGIVTAMTIGFALVSSVIVLPATLTLWARVTDRRRPVGPSPASSDETALDDARVPVRA